MLNICFSAFSARCSLWNDHRRWRRQRQINTARRNCIKGTAMQHSVLLDTTRHLCTLCWIPCLGHCKALHTTIRCTLQCCTLYSVCSTLCLKRSIYTLWCTWSCPAVDITEFCNKQVHCIAFLTALHGIWIHNKLCLHPLLQWALELTEWYCTCLVALFSLCRYINVNIDEGFSRSSRNQKNYIQ